MKLLKKLSAKDILGPVMNTVKEMEVGETRECYAVAGISSGYEKGMSGYGEWTRFVGDFQATNYITGETMRAPKAHIPEVLQSAILSGVGELDEVTESTKAGNINKAVFSSQIEFAFKVAIIRHPDDESGAISYEYITSPLTEMAPNDSLSHLTGLIAAPEAIPALDNPNEGDKKPTRKTTTKK